MQSNDMPCAGSRAAASASSRQARRTVESIEGEDGRETNEPRKDGAWRIVRERPARGRGGDGHAAAVAGCAVAAQRAVVAVRAEMGGGDVVCGVGGVRGVRRVREWCGWSDWRGVRGWRGVGLGRGRFARDGIGSQRQRSHEEQSEQEF
jgi:hypothetical protein